MRRVLEGRWHPMFLKIDPIIVGRAWIFSHRTIIFNIREKLDVNIRNHVRRAIRP